MIASLKLLRALLTPQRIDRVIDVNYWMGIMVIRPSLDSAQVEALTRLLTARFPNHAIHFSDMCLDADEQLKSALAKGGYSFLFSKGTHLFSRSVLDLTPRQRRHLRVDARGFRDGEHALVPSHEASRTDATRVWELFHATNFEKYPESRFFSPDFSEAFFRLVLTLDAETLHVALLQKDDRVDGFVIYFTNEGLMEGLYLGHDQKLPKEVGLYRSLMFLERREALRHGLILNAGPGVHDFKSYRGHETALMYRAVYLDHLPIHRRLGWLLLARIVNGVFVQVGLQSLGELANVEVHDGVFRMRHGPWTRPRPDGAPQALASAIERLEGLDDAALADEVAKLAEAVEITESVLDQETGAREGLLRLETRARKLKKGSARQRTGAVIARAMELLEDAERAGGTAIVVGAVGSATAAELRAARDAVFLETGSVALLLAGERDGKVVLLTALTPDIVDRGVSATDLSLAVAPLVGGRGGGRPHAAMGGGNDPSRIPEMLQAAQAWLESALGA